MTAGDSESVDLALNARGAAIASCEIKRRAWERAWAGLTPPAKVETPQKRWKLFG